MDVSTAVRFHTGEILFSIILRSGIFIIIGAELEILLIYETFMLPVIFLQHSNVYLPSSVDRVLRLVIPTPWMHWVHHSEIYSENNMNFGSLFSFWDRLAGTYMVRNDPYEIHYGIQDFCYNKAETFTGILLTPLK